MHQPQTRVTRHSNFHKHLCASRLAVILVISRVTDFQLYKNKKFSPSSFESNFPKTIQDFTENNLVTEARYEMGSTLKMFNAALAFELKSNLIEKNLNELAEIVSIEHGKTLADAKGSVTRGLEVIEFACGIPHLLKGEFSQNVGTNIDS